MKTVPEFYPYIETTVKEHPGSLYLFSLLRKIDKAYFEELKKEVFKQRALHTGSKNQDKDLDETVATRISNSQVVSKKKNGKLGAMLMSDKLSIYKARKQEYKNPTKVVNVKRRRDDNNIAEL
jgi:hypothetical protein